MMRNQYNQYLVQSSGSGVMEGVVDSVFPVGSADSSDSDNDNIQSGDSSDDEDVIESKPPSKADSGKTPMSLRKSGSEDLLDSLRQKVHRLEKEVEEKDDIITHLQKKSSNEFHEKVQFTNENIDLKSEIKALKSELHQEQSRLEVYRNHSVRHLNEIAEREKMIETLKAKIKKLQEEISYMTPKEDQEETLERLLRENFELKADLEKMKTSDDVKDKTIEKLKQVLSKLQNETRLMLQPNPNHQQNGRRKKK